MRIERLLLERYGHFTGRELDFSSPEVRLHVVLGANEAGKTTALHAVRDLLFGIDERSAFDFLHDYKVMRVGGDISAASGEKLSFKRRKGRKSTLLDGDGGALRDDILVPFLGAADRPLFGGLFGLTHQSLREGSKDLLAARGDIGQMLFEAGGSIRHLVSVLQRLDDEAAELFTPNRSANRKFYKALDVFTDARKHVRGLTVTSDEWRTCKADLKVAQDKLEGVKESLRNFQARRAKAERIRRLLPMLTDLMDTNKKLAEVENAPALPLDSKDRFQKAKQEIKIASVAAEREERDAIAATEQLAELHVPEGLLAMAVEIQLAYERRGAVHKAKEDLPKLQTERRQLHKQLENLVRDIGTGISVDEAVSQIPPEAAIADVRDLINRASAFEGELKAMRSRATEAGADLENLNKRLAETPEQPNTTAFRQAIDSVKGKGDLEGALSDARHGEEVTLGALTTALSALPLWNADAETLASTPTPDETTIGRFERAMEEVADRVRRDKEKLAEAQEKFASTQRELSQLLAGGNVPTGEAVALARRRRDTGWRLVRRVFIDHEKVPDEEIKGFEQKDPLPTAYERAVTQADRLADQRESEAARIARHDALLKSLDELNPRIAELRRTIESNDGVAKQLNEDWAKVWSRTGVEPRTPREMASWLGRRDDVLHLYKDWRDARTRVQKSQEALNQAISTIKTLAPPSGIEMDGADDLSVILGRCEEFVHNVSELATQRARWIEQRNEQELAVDRARSALERLGENKADWRTSWERALARVGLRDDCSVTAAEQVLKTWEKFRTAASQLSDLDDRIRGIERDSAEFADFVSRIIRDAALEIDATNPLRASVEAFSRLQEAKSAATRKKALEDQRDQTLKAASEAREIEALASESIDRLKETAGCESDEALSQAIERSVLKTSLVEKARQLESQIVSQADGLTVDAARAEAEGAQPDLLKAEIGDIDDRISDLMDENRELGGAINELRTKLKVLESGRGAADFAQEMQDAKADLEACAERWMVLKTATFILRRGIERFREEQQGPVLAKARDVFSNLTLGGFVGFRVDYDEQDNPILLGVRPDGDTCPVDGMSDGTRDQLFLALRIAAITNYAASAEPLPFIADDLFVHFDDDRASAGLRALIELGAITQVLFFTHHRHLADLAMTIGKTSAVSMQKL